MSGLFGSLFGGGSAQSNASGNLYSQAANDYQAIGNTVNPFLTNQMNQGFSPTTISAAQNATNDAGLQAINNLMKHLGPSTPNPAGASGDALNSALQADATTSASIAGQNQSYQDQAAQQLMQSLTSTASGLTGIGSQYQQAAQSAPNPFTSLGSIFSMFGPGGSGSSFFSNLLGSLFGGGAAAAPAAATATAGPLAADFAAAALG